VLQVFLPEGDVVVGEPVILESLDVLVGEEDIVVAKVRLIGGKLMRRTSASAREYKMHLQR
jgi:hypothetical protein